MAGKITTNSVVLGDSVTDTQNFVLKTNADGTATLARGALGGLGTVFGVNGSGALTGATLVAPALGTPASGVLTNCTGVPAGALPAGSVLQVVSGTYSTYATSVSATYADTGLTASITPRSTSSKILVFANQQGCQKYGANTGLGLKLFRGATELAKFEGQLGINSDTAYSENNGGCGITYLDSPSTTSATAYKTQFNNRNSAGTVAIQADSATSTITLMEIAG